MTLESEFKSLELAKSREQSSHISALGRSAEKPDNIASFILEPSATDLGLSGRRNGSVLPYLVQI